MISLSIGSATEVYDDASRCEIIRHWVDHPALADFSHSLRALRRPWVMRPPMNFGRTLSARSAGWLSLSVLHHCRSRTPRHWLAPIG